MAKMRKERMAEILKRNGYFFNYKYVCDIVKDFSWKELKDYFNEMLEMSRN